MKIGLFNTVAAVSTPMGQGGIGIVRISGKDSFYILEKIFRPVKKSVYDIKSHTVNYGHILDEERIVDEVLVTFMKAPNTYTREDVVEINCHGGIKAVQSVLNTVLKNGADMAEPGEFTKRAFLNGRIDLTQAEAVIDIINAKTELSQRSAVSRLKGSLSEKIKELRNDILTMTAHIEVSIDYPEHDDEIMTYSLIHKKTLEVMDKINKLIYTADTGKIMREGIKTVIVGKPNVGKSSLLNSLINEDRAIVTDIPGTTRDALEEYVNINGIPLCIVDTAGIRETDDVIERMGVVRSKEYAENADLIFLILDGSRMFENVDFELLEFVKNRNAIVIINKSDLDLKISLEEVYRFVDKEYVLKLSVKNSVGFEALFDKIKNLFFDGDIDIDEDAVVSNERNKNSLYNALKSLENVIETVKNRMPEDFISMDLMEAYRSLGEIIGESVEDDIIDKIFSEFCLGK